MKTLSLYKALLRESEKFTSYNFRNYALRNIKDHFRAHKSLSDASQIQTQLDYGKKSLETIRRQVIIGHLYESDKLVIEAKQD